MNLNNIPDEIRRLPQWVCVKDGSKVPMKAYEPEAASCSNPQTWSSYMNAERSLQAGHYDWLGFVFADNGIVGIDIDAGFDEDGLVTPLAADIISMCGSYTETSRSGRGFHILVKGDIPFKGRNNRNGVEIYKTARYFIMTGDALECCPGYIVENQSAIDEVLSKYFPELREQQREDKIITSRIYSPEWMLPKEGKVKLRPVYPRITPGSRNLCLTSLAGMMHSQGYDKDHILEELSYANTVACDPSLSRRELKMIVSSVTRYKR